MKICRDLNNVPELAQGAVATIGNFDGVHLGHQALLKTLCKEAKKRNLPSLVIVFEPQPGELFLGNQAPPRLSSLREKVQALNKTGVDVVFCLNFKQKLADMTADLFAKEVLFSALHINYLLVGRDFRFGQGRHGDVGLLAKIGQSFQASCTFFDDFFVNEQRVSSTIIRTALQQDDFVTAAHLLGRPYRMCARVIKGDGRGRQWGIPTANLAIKRLKTALRGVFYVKVKRSLDAQWMPAIANLGTRPTVDGRKSVLEVHVLDSDQSLYGELLEVEFIKKRRNEITFSSIEALIEQIQHDILSAKAYFNSINHSFLKI